MEPPTTNVYPRPDVSLAVIVAARKLSFDMNINYLVLSFNGSCCFIDAPTLLFPIPTSQETTQWDQAGPNLNTEALRWREFWEGGLHFARHLSNGKEAETLEIGKEQIHMEV